MDLRSPRTRLLILAGLIAIWTGAALGRLAYLQLFRYSEYYSRAQHQQRLIVEVGARRAEIFDRNLNALAMSVPMDSCFAVPSEIADPDMVARLIGKVLDVSPDEIATRLAGSHSFVWIARKLPPEKAERIAAMNPRGIYFQREGVAVIDIGQHSTELVCYYGESGQMASSIRLCGDHFSRDLAHALRIPVDAASIVKEQFG